MDILTDEHERDEAVRKWWHEHWKPIVLGIAISIAGLVGIRQYQAYELSENQKVAYEVFQLQTQLTTRGAAVEAEVNDFIQSHKDIYGSVLALDLARFNISNANYDKAISLVDFAKSNGGDLVAPQASLVMARLQAQMGKYDDALKTLASVKSNAYKAEMAEVKGDILMAQGKIDEAHDSYQVAIASLKEAKLQISPILQMKFDNVIKPGDQPAYQILAEQIEEANQLFAPKATNEEP